MATVIQVMASGEEEPECIAQSTENSDADCIDTFLYLDGFKDRFCFGIRTTYREIVEASSDRPELTRRVNWAKGILLADWRRAGKPKPI